MDKLITIQEVKKVIIPLRGQEVILDSDVAKIYGVETKRINEAVRNNPEKFPEGYILVPDRKELIDLRSKFLTTKISPKSRVVPKAFTEKGLYMRATILKSPIDPNLFCCRNQRDFQINFASFSWSMRDFSVIL